MIRKEVGLEQFYTPQETANWVVKVLKDQPWWIDIVEAIEPTAGTGVFIDALQPFDHYLTVHAFDLEPKHSHVKKADTLSVNVPAILWNSTHECITPKQHVLLIGNPPFGRQAKLASQIWEHYADYCGYSALIVPRSMSIPKYMTKSKSIPQNHDLLFTLSLPNEYFVLPDNSTKFISGTALLVTRHKDLRDGDCNPKLIRGDDWLQYE